MAKTEVFFKFSLSILLFVSHSSLIAGSLSDSVLLQQISVLTLHSDKMTNGRRSAPVPQLNCVGGTAKGYFTPKVVQCYNRGFDGTDIQWECKADMDNAYRFGSVEVTCEGYSYPNDPYVLRGSCGLEYTLDFTEEGYQRFKQQGQSQGAYAGYDSSYTNYQGYGKKAGSIIGDLLFLGGIALVIYIVYKTCLSSSHTTGDSDRQPQPDMGSNQPPPYGFRPDYVPGSSCYTDTSSTGGFTGNPGTGGGFWTGAATGGLLGYLFGRNNTYTQYQPYNNWGSPRPRSYFSSWGNGGWGSGTSYSTGSSGGSGTFTSSGTRTASGFGGTKRR